MQPVNFIVHIVDPDEAIADGLATLLSTYGIDVIAYPDAETFLRAGAGETGLPGCLLVEADLPGASGPALLEQLDGAMDVVLLVSTSSPDLIEAAKGSDRIRVIEKPCLDGTLVDLVLRIRQQV